MNKRKRRKVRYLTIFFLGVVVIGYLLARCFLICTDNLQNYLETTSHGRRKVIASVKEGKVTYAIISRTDQWEYGDLFAVYEQREKKIWECTYENDFLDLKPWKIEQADIDGDQLQEILIGVKKTTHFDQEEKNRLFIFNYTKEGLVKKWTGSDIAGSWEDFTVGDLLPRRGNELIFIEDTEDKKEKLSIYYWFDFGFLRLAESEHYDDIIKQTVLGENRIQIVFNEGRKKKAVLSVDGGKIVEEK